MNWRRATAIVFATAVFVQVLIPPWRVQRGGWSDFRVWDVYHPIFTSPAPPSSAVNPSSAEVLMGRLALHLVVTVVAWIVVDRWLTRRASAAQPASVAMDGEVGI